jgi:hypothetical protein
MNPKKLKNSWYSIMFSDKYTYAFITQPPNKRLIFLPYLEDVKSPIELFQTELKICKELPVICKNFKFEPGKGFDFIVTYTGNDKDIANWIACLHVIADARNLDKLFLGKLFNQASEMKCLQLVVTERDYKSVDRDIDVVEFLENQLDKEMVDLFQQRREKNKKQIDEEIRGGLSSDHVLSRPAVFKPLKKGEGFQL